MKHQGVWILTEQFEGAVQRISYELLTRGRELADKLKVDLTAVIFGDKIESEGLQELVERGAGRVIVMQSPELKHFLPEPYSACMLMLIEEYRPEIIIAGATSTGRTLMPYVAIKASAGLTADCTVLDIEEETSNLLQTRPAIGGNILATIKTPKHRPQMATVRPHSSAPAQRQKGRKGEIIYLDAPKELLSSRIKRLDYVPDESEHSIQDADIVITVGRGIKKGEKISIVEPLISEFDAALGATRDVVDRGWLGYSHQIGLSGKTTNPKLYVALGVSGAIQHLAGMQTSKTIIAVNTDPDAQIFKVADFGIVGDLFEVVPVICERLKQLRSRTDES